MDNLLVLDNFFLSTDADVWLPSRTGLELSVYLEFLTLQVPCLIANFPWEWCVSTAGLLQRVTFSCLFYKYSWKQELEKTGFELLKF